MKSQKIIISVLIIALCLLPAPVLAENFTLPAKTFGLGSWDQPYMYQHVLGYCNDGCSYVNEWRDLNESAGEAYYNQQWHLFWRVAVKSDGTEKLIDYYLFDGHNATSSVPQPGEISGRYSWDRQTSARLYSEQTVPETTVDLPGGHWTVKLLHAVIPAPTAARFLNITPGSVVDWWEGIPVTYTQHEEHHNHDYYNNYYQEWNTIASVCANPPKPAYNATVAVPVCKLTPGTVKTFFFPIWTCTQTQVLKQFPATPLALYDLVTYHTGYNNQGGADAKIDTTCEKSGGVPAESLGCNYKWHYYFDYSHTDNYGNSYTTRNYDGCWIENETAKNIRVSDRAGLVEYYEIDVAAPPAPEPSGIVLERSAFGASETGSPLSPDTGVSAPDSEKAGLAAVLAVAAIGAGAYLYRSYVSGSGSAFSIFRTAVGNSEEAKLNAQREDMEQKRLYYEQWLANEAEKSRKKKYLEGQDAARQERINSLKADLAAVDKNQFLDEKSRLLGKIRREYSDILTDDGKAKLADAANQCYGAWAGIVNAPRTAVSDYVSYAMAPAQECTFSGAMSGVGKSALIWGYDTVSILKQALSGDVKGALGTLLERGKENLQVLWAHRKEILEAAAVGFAIGAAVIFTGGVAAIPLVPLFVYLVGKHIVDDYGPVLCKLDQDATIADITNGKISNTARADYESLHDMLLVDEVEFAAAFGGGMLAGGLAEGLVEGPEGAKLDTGELTSRTGGIYVNELADKYAAKGYKVRPPEQVTTSKGSTDIDLPMTGPDGTVINMEAKLNIEADITAYQKDGFTRIQAEKAVANDLIIKFDKFSEAHPNGRNVLESNQVVPDTVRAILEKKGVTVIDPASNGGI